MRRKIIIAAGILLVGLIATAAFAYGGGRGHGGWFCDGRGMMAGFSGLNLTAEQTAKMDALRDSHQKEVQPLRDKMFAKRTEMKALWLETNPDPVKINAAQKEVQALRNQMEEKRTAFRFSALNLLTAEQKTAFQKSFQDKEQGKGPGGCAGGPGSGGHGHGRW